MRYSLRTLLIALPLVPPVLAISWWLLPRITQGPVFVLSPWELLSIGIVVFILLRHRLPSLMRTLFRDF